MRFRHFDSLLRLVLAGTALIQAGTALAQTGASFRLEEHAFNSGGHPADGSNPASGSFRISLGAIGDAVSPGLLSSPSFRLDGNFVSAYPPPGDVLNLRFTSTTSLVWDPEKSTGDYNLYRSSAASAVNACLQSEIAGETATDTDSPASGAGFFYLVTAEDRLDEEGTKGFRTDGTERANPTPCP